MKAELTSYEKMAMGAPLAEACLILLVPLFFVFADPLSRFIDSEIAQSVSLRPSFIDRQYHFLLAHGADAASVTSALRIFELLIWVLIVVVVLRVLSTIFLFGLMDIKGLFRAQRISVSRFVISLAVMAGAVWASTDIRFADSDPLFGMLVRSPRVYVCLEAFVFVSASILLVEGLLVLIELAVSAIRGRIPSRTLSNSGR
jgi:hypothetical protein